VSYCISVTEAELAALTCLLLEEIDQIAGAAIRADALGLEAQVHDLRDQRAMLQSLVAHLAGATGR